MSDRRERIAAQALAGLMACPDLTDTLPEMAGTAVAAADALIAALGEPVVCESATYKHPATGRDFYLSRNGVGGYSWVARDGSKTLDTGSAATEREAIAQAVAAVERG